MYRRSFAAFALVLPVVAYAQTGALPVNIQGQLFDRSDPSNPPPVEVSERFDAASGTGPQIMISPDGWFSAVLYSNASASTLFNLFQIPGVADDFSGVALPSNALYFFGSVPNNTIAASTLIYSGMIELAVDPITPLYEHFVYAGGPDNPIVWDTAQDPPSLSLDGPLFSWDYISGGLVGNADNTACQPAAGPIPDRVQKLSGTFIAVIERGGCNFSPKLINAAAAGARAAIIFNRTSQGDDLLQMYTPGSSIPGVLVTPAAGQKLLSIADQNASPGVASFLGASLQPTNIFNSINGSFTLAEDGSLSNVNLNFYIEDQNDHILVGTITGVGVPAPIARPQDHPSVRTSRGKMGHRPRPIGRDR
ncbi:MAG TPA: PA domain-containing protein [Bryobacteraceae bacterium]|nr:PA domain-containing protein [Bryobacteraceae bacterium]